MAHSILAANSTAGESTAAREDQRAMGRLARPVNKLLLIQFSLSSSFVFFRRRMVELPPLKPELERRQVYFYRTKEQSALKLKAYDDKINLLVKKEGKYVRSVKLFP